MNILLKNLSNTFNYGSMMMGENLIYEITSKTECCVKFYIQTNDEQNLERLRKATGCQEIYNDNILSKKLLTEKIKYVRYVEKVVREKINYLKACNFYDAVIYLGGDDFAETYYTIPNDNKIIKHVLKEVDFFSRKCKTFMIGQTIGPYTGIRKEWASKYLSNARIYTRDDKCFDYLKKELNINSTKSRDLAFLDLNLQEEYEKKCKTVLNSYNIKSSEYITFVGTGLLNSYTNNEKEMLTKILDMLKAISVKFKNKKIVYLSHVVLPKNSSDNNMIEKLKKLDSKFMQSIIIIDHPILPAEARVILGNGYFTLTFRMHAAVSTFQMGKPAISFAYSKKYEGVIGDGLNMHDLIIDCRGDYDYNNLRSDALNKVNLLVNDYDEICAKIKKNVLKCKTIVEETLEDVVKILESDKDEK